MVDPDVLDLQGGVGQRAGWLRQGGPFAALDAVGQHPIDTVEVNPFEVDRPTTVAHVVNQLNSDVRSYAGPDLPADPDDVMPALDDEGIGQDDGVIKDVILSDLEVHKDEPVQEIAVTQRHGDWVDQGRGRPGQERRGWIAVG